MRYGRKRVGSWIVLLLMLLLFTGCNSLAGRVLPRGLVLDRTELVFTSMEQSYRLSATVEPADAELSGVQWTSSDPDVAQVDGSGLVTPVGNGEALISVTAKSGIGAASCSVLVSAVSSLSLNLHTAALEPGQTLQLVCVTQPGSGSSDLLHWWVEPAGGGETEDEIVSVGGDGLVTALNPGQAEVHVRAAYGDAEDVCLVTVTRNVPLENIELDPSSLEITTPGAVTLTPVFTPADTSQRAVEWTSSDPSVVTVDRDTGELTPVANGKAVITVRSLSSPALFGTCEITVNLNVPLRGLSLERDSYTFRDFNQTYLISPVFTPAEASNKNITYTSSDPSVASVSAGGLVTSHKNGAAEITLRAEDGGYTATFRVTVAREDPTVKVTGLTLNSYSQQLAALGETVKIRPTVLPSNATDKAVTYLSRNPSVAKVSADGTVTAVAFGTAEIVVTTKDGGYSEVFLLTVVRPEEPEPEPEPEPQPSEELRGVWVATVYGIDFPSRTGLSAGQLRAEIDAIMDDAMAMGLNAVFFQVRPASDALYASDLFPASAYITGKQGDPLPMDVLEYAIQAAHKRGLQLHAWINPYRVTTSGTNLTVLAESNPARQHPEWVVSNGRALFYNPGLPEVRQLILDGVMEIVKNYNVDGIHFDDYFYPTDGIAVFDDSAAYAKYGGGMTLADWRRDNNDQLIRSVAQAVRAYDSSVRFGVSPAAVWAVASSNPNGVPIKAALQTYYELFADTRKWVLNEWVDYICPQIYFQMDHPTAPFKPIADWWNDLVSGTDVRLYIGIAAYKGDPAENVPAFQTSAEIQSQLDYLDGLKSVSGVVFYNYSSLKDNLAGVRDLLAARYYRPPQEGASDRLIFSSESMTVDSSYSHAYVLGVSDPNYPLFANGEEVPRSYQGYFAYYATLKSSGTTTVTFEHKGQTYTYNIYKETTVDKGSSALQSFAFVPGSFTPSYDYASRSGTTLRFSCKAPADAEVYVMIGSLRVDLTATSSGSGRGKYKVATYEGALTLPQVDGDGNRVLGYAIFYAQGDGESAQFSPGCMIEVINDFSLSGAEIIKDKIDVLPNLEVDPDLYYMGTFGTKVFIVSKADGYAKLSNGMYISIANLRRVDGTVPLAEVQKSAVSSVGKYTTLSLQMNTQTMHTVWMDDDAAVITLYQLKNADIPLPSLSANPLFSAVSVKKVDDATAQIVLTYRKSLHIYGYYANFDGTTLYVNFRNPVTLGSDDKLLQGVVVSLDPGHSDSSGAIGSFGNRTMEEADLALDLTLRVEEKLKALGATVVLTHRGEGVKSLDELIPEYRKLSPDINVSIHFNAVDESSNPNSAKGAETWWCYNNSHLLADVMLSKFTDLTGLKKRSSKCGYYKVSRLCEFPSILFETAFITNPDDFEWFTSEENRDLAAEGIAQGIVAYFQEQNS